MVVSVKVDRDLPKGDLLLQGARVITMNGYEILENADIHIKDNRIQGSWRYRDAAEYLLIPGLFRGDR